MEALKPQTIDDLLASPEQRVEFIDGEILRRPMTLFSHGVVQGNTGDELGPFEFYGQYIYLDGVLGTVWVSPSSGTSIVISGPHPRFWRRYRSAGDNTTP